MTSHCGERILRIDLDEARTACFARPPLPHTSEAGRRIIGGNPRCNRFEENELRGNLTQVTAEKTVAKLERVAGKRLTNENRARKRPAAVGNTVVRRPRASAQVVAEKHVMQRQNGPGSFAGRERHVPKPLCRVSRDRVNSNGETTYAATDPQMYELWEGVQSVMGVLNPGTDERGKDVLSDQITSPDWPA